jgi:hypothetical protein
MSSTTPTPGSKCGDLLVIASDNLGRRVTCLCVCKQVCTIASADLASGLRTSCGCQRFSSSMYTAYREAQDAMQRQKDLL